MVNAPQMSISEEKQNIESSSQRQWRNQRTDSAPTGQHAGLPCYVIAIETVRFPTIVERTTNRQLKAPPNVLMSLLYGQSKDDPHSTRWYGCRSPLQVPNGGTDCD
ncbi:uncharacterized protein LOC142728938 isoform X4 [Rhinoderma darwinii]|uniref:uncharacterized protein LOC142728938 isoform X4 n=1 Tax=Rhinoderma darwinii TaxID=43563 RepID=UPI003F67EC42